MVNHDEPQPKSFDRTMDNKTIFQPPCTNEAEFPIVLLSIVLSKTAPVKLLFRSGLPDKTCTKNKKTEDSNTENIANRLTHHNSGGDPHTQKYRPWDIKTYMAFSDRQRALDFERYSKTASGRAFAKKTALGI